MLNKDSTLKRLSVTIHDAIPEVMIERESPVRVEYVNDYFYESNWNVQTYTDIKAIEARFILFDIWNERTKVLSASYVLDIPNNDKHDFESKWKIYSENEASEHYASIAYISRARAADGRVLLANSECVLREAKRIHESFEQKQLDPDKNP